MHSHTEFFSKHNIPSSITIDGNGKSLTREFQDYMKEEGFYFAYNVNPCARGGHTIRDRHRHCIVCDTSNIRFQLRPDEEGDVYIVGSKMGNLLKIGCTKNVDNRIESLNRTRYADFNDWVVLYYCSIKSAGRIEELVHNSLKEYAISGIVYYHASRNIVAHELFRCGFTKAINTLLKVLRENKIEIIKSNQLSVGLDCYEYK